MFVLRALRAKSHMAPVNSGRAVQLDGLALLRDSSVTDLSQNLRTVNERTSLLS